jgi:hypothetical protein
MERERRVTDVGRGQIHPRLARSLESAHANVTHDPDDGAEAVLEQKAPAHRVLARPVPFRKGRTHDRDTAACRGRIFEIASGEERDIECSEELP